MNWLRWFWAYPLIVEVDSRATIRFLQGIGWKGKR